MEIVEAQPVQRPVLQLFGKPTAEPMLRVDSAHSKIRRPHFLDRGEQRGMSPGQSGSPDLPQPGEFDPTEGQPKSTPQQPQRPGYSPSRAPVVPARPAAAMAGVSESASATLASARTMPSEPATPEVSETVGNSVAKAASGTANVTRMFRVDTRHAAHKPGMAKPPKIVSVQPAPALTQGSDILDRVLASVQKGQ